MSTDEKREKMLSLVADWKASGLTQKAFSALHGIKVATLGYWVARSKELDGGNFIPITSGSARNSEPIEIIYPTGVRLRIEANLALIAQLIRL
ncbi:MAG: IS66 family insertion sequence element accessory protein TnpA [Sphingobacterium sp.]